MSKLSPIESEFETMEDAEAHDAWARAKVERSLARSGQLIPHDEVMAEMRRLIEERRAAAGSLAA